MSICRAAALHQRGWTGDAAFALRDCECALACEPGDPDAMLMRAQMLLVLGQLEVHIVSAGHAYGVCWSAFSTIPDVPQQLLRLHFLLVKAYAT